MRSNFALYSIAVALATGQADAQQQGTTLERSLSDLYGQAQGMKPLNTINNVGMQQAQ